MLKEHQRERAALEEIRQKLIQPAARNQRQTLILPDIPGEQLCRTYPELAFSWGEKPDLHIFSGVLLDGLPADTKITPEIYDRSKSLRTFLENDSYARKLYDLN